MSHCRFQNETPVEGNDRLQCNSSWNTYRSLSPPRDHHFIHCVARKRPFEGCTIASVIFTYSMWAYPMNTISFLLFFMHIWFLWDFFCVSQPLKNSANNPLSNQEQTTFNLYFILKVSWLEIKDYQQSLPSVKNFLCRHKEIGYCYYQQVICSTDIRRNYRALELQLCTQANSRIPTLTSEQIDEQWGLLLSGAK